MRRCSSRAAAPRAAGQHERRDLLPAVSLRCHRRVRAAARRSSRRPTTAEVGDTLTIEVDRRRQPRDAREDRFRDAQRQHGPTVRRAAVHDIRQRASRRSCRRARATRRRASICVRDRRRRCAVDRRRCCASTSTRRRTSRSTTRRRSAAAAAPRSTSRAQPTRCSSACTAASRHYVNQVGPQCVKVDQFGRWIGDPVNGALTGTTTTGTAFNEICPRDSAVSGFRGALVSVRRSDRTSSAARYAERRPHGRGHLSRRRGGTGGTAQGRSACGTGNPVYALYGRSGGWLDNFGVLCRPGAITPISTNSSPVIVNPGAQAGVVGVRRRLADHGNRRRRRHADLQRERSAGRAGSTRAPA